MDQFQRLMELLSQLEATSTYYTLSKHRTDYIMATVVVPGERWEIEFGRDGEIAVEQFVSNGGVGGEKRLKEFCEQWLLPELDPDITNPNSETTSFTLDAAGRITRQDNANTTYTLNTWDNANH